MGRAGAWAASRNLWLRLRELTDVYLANDDRLAASSNSGAFLVWGSQPFYPFYVWLLVGHDAWPSFLTWLSTPLFVAVPLVARINSIWGRTLFVVAGIANTLLSTKAFGLDTQVVWFLVPCFILAVGFFRLREWRVGVSLAALTLAASVVAFRLGVPLHAYSEEQARSLSHLNLWSVAVLSVYLAYLAICARRHPAHGLTP